MGLTFEHNGIKIALANAGVTISYLNNNDAEGESTLPVFISWSSRESLLLRPEYAWLSRDDVSQIQLPQPLDILLKRLERSTHPWISNPENKILMTPLGQWRWAVVEFQVSLPRGNRKELFFRLSALRRFAVKHWPGWFEKILHVLALRLDSSSVSSEDAQALLKRADAAAVFEACHPLLGWSEGQQKGRRVATFEDALSYTSQGVGGVGDILKLAAEDPWWDEMERDLYDTETALQQVSKNGGTVDQSLRNSLAAIKANLMIIRRSREITERASLGETRETHIAVNSLMRTVGDILKQHDRNINDEISLR